MLIFVSILGFSLLALARTAPPSPKLDGKIVGGKDATIEQHPYQLAFEVYNEQTCGASLIKPDIAVTAAHCTDEVKNYPITALGIRAGSSLRQSGGQVAKVKKICQHPKYNKPIQRDYDVSVLVLDRSFSLSASIQTIALQTVDAEISDGVLAHVTGWGNLKAGGSSSSKLQVVQVPKVGDSNCAKYYPKGSITNRMVCFGYVDGGKDACEGDSGGPLAANGKLVGIVSWGYSCAAPKHPGIYAKVSNKEIYDFINSCQA